MGDMDDSDAYDLVLAFDTDETEFMRGFEAGMLWERMQHEQVIEHLIHAENAEMVMRMCEARGWIFVGDAVDECWIKVALVVGPHGD